MRRALMFMLTVVLAPMLARAADDMERVWQALRVGGNIVLLRHAAAPGVGDPPEFRLDDCATQRVVPLPANGGADRRRPGDASSDAELVLRSGRAGGAANRGVARLARRPAAQGLAYPGHAPSQYHRTHRYRPGVWRGGGGEITPKRLGRGSRAYTAALTSPALLHAVQAFGRRWTNAGGPVLPIRSL